MHTFLISPTGSHAGLTSASVGLVHAMDRLGMRVGFFKPISQSYDENHSDLSSDYVRVISSVDPPDPIPMEMAREWIATDRSEDLLEEIVSRYEEAARDADVIIVEGLQASSQHAYLNSLNPRIARALNADVILVSGCNGMDASQLNQHLETASENFGGVTNNQVLGVILNQVEPSELVGSQLDTPDSVLQSYQHISRACSCLRKGQLKLIGVIPHRNSLQAYRVSDLLKSLNAKVVHLGEASQRRVTETHLCARDISHLSHVFTAGSLIVTPADRSDVIIGAAYASLKGIQLAGLVLTGDLTPEAEVLQFCMEGFRSGLPVLQVDTPSFVTAQNLTMMPAEIPADDITRIKQLVGHIARNLDISWLEQQCKAPPRVRLSPPAFRYLINQKARSNPKRIVLPEGNEPRTLEAATICHRRKIALPVLIGDPNQIRSTASRNGIDLSDEIEIINPENYRDRYVAPLVEKRKHKGISATQAASMLEDDIYLATMMLATGDADGLVSGAVHSTSDTIRPALQIIGTAPGSKGVSSVFFMCLPEQVLVYGDCAVNLDPTPEMLADIAVQSTASAEAFGIDPKVAMISYSTLGSGSGADVEKVIAATEIVKAKNPNMIIDGPLQYDAASNIKVAKTKAPNSSVAGQATVFIFPDLNTGNTTYKAVQRSANVVSIGPILQGLAKPVNDLSRGAEVDDIVFTIAITCIQAQQ